VYKFVGGTDLGPGLLVGLKSILANALILLSYQKIKLETPQINSPLFCCLLSYCLVKTHFGYCSV